METNLRTMGIVGLDYCGSTLVSNVLSSLPGVLNIGESHWIIDRNLGCRECHNKPCPVFTNSMLYELRNLDFSKKSWWDTISNHTDADMIISSDKLPKHYELFGVPDKLLFLYKNPNSNIESWCRRKFSKNSSEKYNYSDNQIEAGIKWWLDISERLVEWTENQNRDKSILSLEEFAENPRAMTMSLCGWLGLEFDPSSLDYWNRDLHYIGGNHSVKRLEPNRHFFQRITVDKRWKDHLSSDQINTIDNHRAINEIMTRIENINSNSNSSFFRLP